MKVGVIYTAYNAAEYVPTSLAPWVDLKYRYGMMSMPVGDSARPYSFDICAINVRFAGFNVGAEDGTRDLLRTYATRGDIELFDGPDNVPETTARGMALAWLRDRCGVDMVIQVDADEFYTVEQIHTILAFVERDRFSAWWRVALKNYVFDDRTYLTEPFTPPRIHRIRVDGYRAHSFSGDNDIQYGGTITRDIVPQSRFPSVTVSASVAWVRHVSWPNSSRSRDKVAYQATRWGAQTCSFAWDDTKGLVFNPALPVPRTSRDE